MRSKRTGALCAVVLYVAAFGCAQVDPQDDPSATQTAAAQSTECIEGNGDNPSIQWQNTVVDIEPTSRFGDETDTAVIRTTVATNEDDADDVWGELRKIDDADIERSGDGRLFQVTRRVEVEADEDEDGAFRFSMQAPLEGTELAKDGDVTVIVHLPRPSAGRNDTPAYEVELVSASQDEPASDPTIYEDEDALGERTTIVWHWCVDPLLDLVYLLS